MKNKSKLIILIILIVIFIVNTILVMNNQTEAIDAEVRELVMNLEGNVMDKIMRVFTFLGSTYWIIGISVVAVILFFIGQRFRASISVAVMIALSALANNIVKIIVRRPRPSYMVVNESTFCYPSGHTMNAAMIYGFLAYLFSKSKYAKNSTKVILSVLLILLVLFIGLSRIYLGAHYFSDVLNGMLASGILILAFDIINDKKNILKIK